MIRNLKVFLFVSVFLLAGFLLVGGNSSFAQERGRHHIQVCSHQKDSFNCNAHVVTDDKGKPLVTVSPYGLGPVQLTGAYGIPSSPSAINTIAIVDAYDDPYVYSDVNTYSSYFGIQSLSSCPVTQGTVSRPCFQKVNQSGKTFYPKANSGWGLEISLDVETAHALCPSCNILLVEASSASYTNLMAAVDRAVLMGAKIVSNSYGSNEFSSETSYDFHFNKPGVAFTFSSGDSGYGVEYPAASPYVTAVGGTTLTLNGNGYGSESVWSGSGSGCSVYESKPTWQKDAGCTHRTVADVSADADPNSGAAVYDSFAYFGSKGWFTVGGTSLASPIIASVYAYGGISSVSMANSLPYATPSSLHDVISGSNGICSLMYLCTGVIGYDGPSGLGSPNGIAGF